MKKRYKYILSLIGMASVLVFCVSATAGITDGSNVAKMTFSEPLNLLLLGFGLIGLGSFIKNRWAN